MPAEPRPDAVPSPALPMPAAVTPLRYQAVIFDMDGVVTDTATVHRTVWKALFDSVLADARAGAASGGPFEDSDYYAYVDGRPREQGVLAFLRSRGVDVPLGSADDAPWSWTAYGLGAAKNALFMTALQQDGVRAYPGTAGLLGRLRRDGVPVALVTASRNAAAVLAAAGLEGKFDAVVDGSVAAELRLEGKPDPATFLEAARRLGVSPSQAVVIEDSTAGVEAARSGGFGLVVGIDRVKQRTRLEAAGADLVLRDPGELDIGLVLSHPWQLIYDGFDPWHEGHREALTTLGNGRMGTRGTAPEARADSIHYPGTYAAGIFNRVPEVIGGETAWNEHMVNLPNWLPVDLRFGSGGWWSEGGLILRREHRSLDMQRAVLTRRVLLEDGNGRQLDVVQRRIVSMASPALAALETTVTARGWDGPVEFRTGIDADIRNANVAEDASLGNRHLHTRAVDSQSGMESAEVETTQSQLRIAVAVRVTFRADAPVHSSRLPGAFRAGADSSRWLQHHHGQLRDGEPLGVLKTAAVVTSRDRAISTPASGAHAVLARTPADFSAVLADHQAAWRRLLHLFTLDLHADGQTQLVLNLHVFHLLQVLTPITEELDVGVPARGLHGEGYRGHIFWDDLFVLPLVTSRLPSITRSVLNYRWRRLGAARDTARAAGLAGALYPWRSGSDGTEETPRWLYNRFSRKWMRDNSRLQRHGSLAVAYNVWQYFQATEDRQWLISHGAEIIVEVARMIASMAGTGEDGRFHLRGVVGPDEYHDGYPGHPGSGVDDNAYTNIMAAWLCALPARILKELHGQDSRYVRKKLGITQDELAFWKQLGRRLYVPFHDGLISQFEGYGRLKELDWDHYRRRYGNIERLDLILASEGDSTNDYKLSKQADVLMLLYVLGEEELVRLLRRMNYDVGPEQIRAMVDYYLSRTIHGSTLSRVAHASVLSASDPERAWDTFRDALDADLDDTQGGTTRTGVHLGAMAGTIDVVQRSFAGLRMESGDLVFTPRLPSGLRRVSFRVRYRGVLLNIILERTVLRVSAAPGSLPPVRVRVGDVLIQLRPGRSVDIPLEPAAAPSKESHD
ncbi:beta-phosphoglucomutase family hydrolase [Arthrobacter sp. APC 3897]|uniref:beta-phosphoglucomutase family hydrolase n=1 Tax=Arthrobacter sp. APC 3897 TaxID=3035204 RepID=UPI0025B358B2|nr:beta-phosphoglucomutase family hydrolase [Arthrobacter sp. APC 3897]MDN3481244.1 beta-phosphoglucomutase family hydrolase [Arthrobacter sp. APC 3897]